MTGKVIFASHGTTDGVNGNCSIPVNKEQPPERQSVIVRLRQFANEFTGHGVNRYLVLYNFSISFFQYYLLYMY